MADTSDWVLLRGTERNISELKRRGFAVIPDLFATDRQFRATFQLAACIMYWNIPSRPKKFPRIAAIVDFHHNSG
jgi:hypothetical protein